MKAELLRERFAFDKRSDLAEPGDGSGDVRGDWVEQFRCWAGIQYVRSLRGGESVLASRLQGIQICFITVRSTTQTRQVDASWRARQISTGVEFNLKGPTPSADKSSIDILAETGTAVG